MRVISIGDIVTDYYYKNSVFLGINGGMTSHNIIANLAKQGIKTAVFGACGNDMQGEIAIKSLKNLKVDVSNIKIIENVRTRCFHISYFEENNKLNFISKKRCPFCNNKKWYEESLIDFNDIINNIDCDDILVFDNLNNKNQEIIDIFNNKKIIDLGQYFEFENLDNKTIVKKIKSKFEIINFNERVSNYLIKKLGLTDDLELFKKLKPKFMTITRGEKGSTFIYNNKIYNYTLLTKGEVVDSTGAGDAFISCIIKEWIKNNFEYNPEIFAKWYEKSNKLTKKVVSKMGARGHINSLFKVKGDKNCCTCDNFIYNERKQIKRCNININNLETRIINAINSSAYDKLNDIEFNLNYNYLFIGTGGSYAGAYFSSKVINLLYGSNTYSMYPRDVIYRNNNNIDKVILFSYSGTTNDIIFSVKNFNRDNIYIITKGELQKIVLKTEISKKNIISYRTASNKGKERGFLSFEGAIVPATLFLKKYIDKEKLDIDIEKFIKKSINYWNKKFESLITKETILKMKKYNLINLFRGDYGDTACYDLESKIIESGLFNCIVHEKKNFSHGRFINYENLNNKFSIFFKQNNTSKYEYELLDYLDDILLIESPYNGILAEYDLLIASQYIIYYIGKIMNIDVSKPNYSEKAMKIYFYKGEL